MARIPRGTCTNSKALDNFPEGVGRLVEATGHLVRDEFGREYVDVISGLGAIILGHCDPLVLEAAHRQLGLGQSFSLPTPLEEEVAEVVCRLVPSAEMVRFAKSGHESTMAAVRLARYATGRKRILVVRPGYHGMDDWYQALHDSPGTADTSASWVERDSEPATWWEPDSVAAVILEPVVATDPELPRAGWLQAVREWCDRHGVLLIFDEIVTFGRFPHLTAQQHFSVTPDLTCLGKCMGNGLPLSAVCGRRDVTELMADRVFFSTTFGGEAVSLAAAKACLEKLERKEAGRAIWDRGQRFMGRLREMGLDVYGYPSRPVVRNEPDGFQRAMIERGVLYAGYFNLTWSMTDKVLDRMAEVCRDALATCQIR